MKKYVYSILVVSLVFLLLAAGAAFAEETAEETVYTLTYPDGSVVTTTDEAEAKKLESEWKLLYTGKTDAEVDRRNRFANAAFLVGESCYSALVHSDSSFLKRI